MDFFSLDVEGAETTILSTLGLGSHLAVGVLMVEVRDDGQRGTNAGQSCACSSSAASCTWARCMADPRRLTRS